MTLHSTLAGDVDKLKASLPALPEPVLHPAFVVVSGLPGTGKSFFCRRLGEQAPFLLLESDALRQVLFPDPTHSAEESTQLFAALHAIVKEYLSRGISIILDATSSLERHREVLYGIAEQQGAKLVIVRVEAPPEVVRQRLEARRRGVDSQDRSQADWSVYQRMKASVERIRRPHFAVDTSRDIMPVIQKVIRAIAHDRSHRAT